MRNMDCEHCQDALLDLASGEPLPDVREAALAHLRDCDRCRGDLARLEAGLALAQSLPDEEPPPGLGTRVRALADAHATASDPQVLPSSTRPRGRLPGWVDFVARFALEHQVAMAAVFLVVVAVGVWSLPKLQSWPEVAGGAVVNPEHSGEAAPSAALAPAEPLDLKVDHRRGRIRTAEEVEAAERARPAAPEPASPHPWPGAEDIDDEYALAERALRASGAAAPAEADQVAVARESPAKKAAAKPDRDLDDLLARNALHEGALRGAAAAAPEPASARVAAASAPARKQEPGSAAAALEAARAARAASGCTAALPRYREIVTRFPNGRDAGEALLESARCERELGRATAARRDLLDAARIPSAATRARQLLDALPQSADTEPTEH